MRRLSSLLLALGFCFGVAIAIPSVAAAHDVLEKTTPSDGSSVDRLPGAVVLTFAEPPLSIGTQVVVTGPSGNVASGVPTIDGSVVRQALLPTAPAGDYTVTYRVTSDDGHPVSGSFSFHAAVGLDGSTATAGASVHVSPQPTPGQEAESSPFVPILLTILGTAVLIVIGGYIVLRGREADRSEAPVKERSHDV
jgi:methionine-rich copper-binding protein CopC